MTAEFIRHTTAASDRWDTLALHFYGDAFRLEPLLRANPTVAMLTVLPEGLSLRIPIVEEAASTASTLPPWRL